MAKRSDTETTGASNGRENPSLNEHAARSSALLTARANAQRATTSNVAGARRATAGGGQQKYRPRESQQEDFPRRSRPESPRHPRSLAEFIRQNAVYIISVAVVVFVVALGIILLRMVLPSPSVSAEEPTQETGYVIPYDWSNLDLSGGRYRYVVDGKVKSRLGVDVSESQHEIDWEAVAADGIDFAIVRVGYRGTTEGDLYLDDQFWNNIDGARAAGLDCGAYFFSQARTVEEAVEEAEFVLEYLDGIPLEYPIAFDSEAVVLNGAVSRTAGIAQDEMTAIAEAFCSRVEKAGYASMIYGNEFDLVRYRHASLEQNRVWWAEYGDATPDVTIDVAMWQYSNNGSVAGIPTVVDMNIDLSHALD